MKRVSLLLCLLVFSRISVAQPSLDVLSYWKFYQPQAPITYYQLMDSALNQLAMRDSRVADIQTTTDWEDYRVRLHEVFFTSVGTHPERTPLRATITSTVEVDGVIAENLHYQSLPGYYVSATFFKPKAMASNKLPVIVYASGHSELAYRSEAYQTVILNYVKKGFGVLAFDPVGQGERIQYRGDDGVPLMGPTHDHSYSGSRSFLLGHSPSRYFIWDGIRAIDYLETRADVDVNRIGLAGRSGGGTQTAYIAAVDERVAAAAPECYITTYETLLKSRGPQDAEQILLNGIQQGIDIPDLLHMRAPKPTLVVATTNDIFSIQGTHVVSKELAQLYHLAGEEGSFQLAEDNAGHESTRLNREATYRFFAKHLDNPCNTRDESVTFFTPEQLWATETGDVFQLTGSKRLSTIIAEQPWTMPSGITPGQIAEAINYKPADSDGEVVFSGTVQYDSYEVDKYLVKVAGNYYIPILVYKNEGVESAAATAALYLDEQGKSANLSVILKLLNKHGCVISADLSGIGELKAHYDWQGDALVQGTPLNLWFLSLLTGQTLTQYRMVEIDALYDFATARLGYSNIVGVAAGTPTIDMLYWSTIHQQKLDHVTLLSPLVSFRAIIDNDKYKPEYLLSAAGGVLQTHDLPDLIRQQPLGSVLLVNPVNACGTPLKANNPLLRSHYVPESYVLVTDMLDAI